MASLHSKSKLFNQKLKFFTFSLRIGQFDNNCTTEPSTTDQLYIPLFTSSSQHLIDCLIMCNLFLIIKKKLLVNFT